MSTRYLLAEELHPIVDLMPPLVITDETLQALRDAGRALADG